ncbi:MFS transporter [Achromobacter sp. K91]|jgi:MFS family permease|uniref:MFS transporter n=1 Tax=Achromobacter aegrifaciens TaxID=1287736 RepID=A0ABU2DFN7_ACHAE|nr:MULTISPECIES: MFS transporter [Achromobacter]MBD9420614.1 MHS family MFS transporter [Achromobacter sp. ACM04]MBD9472090.1 MHS family MFS transporter [Achromobacter sp. ACM01]MDR7946929.1 MFS transporter [Achromobacter aegrifaciens]RIJ03163.1 MFS transporter [Achromobacter sp. K91]CAB3627626.1 Fosfomycin resistance protein AbaF [Achromobacter aegrifaciens]
MNAISQQPSSRSKKHYVTAGLSSMIGTTIEWYDFFLYGIAAALIFNKIYFPAIDPISGTLAAFGTYAVGFIARPLGGIVFGHFGDRVGRKSMLMISLMLMGVPTILIGLTPSYETIGYWGAVALVFFRFLQGLAVGGEWGGAVLMAVEHAPEGKKGLFGSLPQVGVAPGLILSSLAMGAVSRLPEADMLSWGWRLPFLASVFLLLVGWYIRAKVSESPEFKQAQAQPKPDALPLKTVLREHKVPVLTALVACISEKTWFYTLATFSLTYAVGTLGLPRETILTGVIWGAVGALFTIPLFGLLGDMISKRAIFIAGALGISLFSATFFSLLDEKTAYHTNIAMLVAFGLVYAAMYAQESSLFSSMFPPDVRYTGISLAVQIGGAIGGGTAPLVATYLLSLGGGSPRFIVLYLAGLGLIAAACGVLMRPYGKPQGASGAKLASAATPSIR